ncbi:hypothetical protein V1504DRAFT_65871 [Lipomyces starkeyi]
MFDMVDFLNVFQEMRNRTFKSRTIKHAWTSAGLIKPGKPEDVYEKTKEFQKEKEPAVPVTTRPMTPEPKSFMRPPTTQDREAHLKYLDQRLIDHID